MLNRAHTPKLNVKYEEVCGGQTSPYCSETPGYSDGINWEADFNAVGNLINNNLGFINCTTKPTTIIENGYDDGNFKGVAFFKDNLNNSFSLTSELEFGWYRYVIEWTFFPEGRIEPRFKFSAVNNNCTCHRHVHHVYWRFDFDVNGPENYVSESYVPPNPEFNPNNSGQVSGPTFQNEITRNRDLFQIQWYIHGADGKYVELIPGPHDGNGDGDSWAKGDVFIAKKNPNPADLKEWVDEVSHICFNEEGLINDENIYHPINRPNGDDIEIWYRGGALHDEDISDPNEHHIVGPTIQCSWRLPVITIQN